MSTVPGPASGARMRNWESVLDPMWLIGGLLVGLVIWVGCGLVAFLARGGMDACGGLFGDTPVGWPEARGAMITAAVIGGVLWAAAVAAVGLGRLSQDRIMLVFPVSYVVALIVFCSALAPAYWGPIGCKPAPSIFGF